MHLLMRYIFISIGFNFFLSQCPQVKNLGSIVISPSLYIYKCQNQSASTIPLLCLMRFPLHLCTPALNFLVLHSINITVKAKLQRLNLGFIC